MAKNPHAVALGRLGGAIGGRARAENMSAKERSEAARNAGLAGGPARAKSLTKAQRSAIAKKAAAARWGPKKAAAKKKTG